MSHRSHRISLALTVAFGFTACGSDDPSTADPVSEDGTGGTPMAGRSGTTGTSGAGAAGRTGAAGSTVTGRAGAAAAPATGGAGSSATAGSNAAAGSGGAAAGSGGAAAGSGGAAAGSGGAAAGSGGAAAGSGGAGGSAGAAGSAGSGAGGVGGSVGPAGGNGGMATPGQGGMLRQTQIVGPGQTFDGGGKRYTAGPALGDGSQSESQQPMFRVENGGTLKNVVLGAPAADGVHTYGNVTLENIVWEDIGEDAMTIKEEGTVTLNGGSASKGEDKVFQINAASTFKVSNFTARDAGKFIRQNGDTTFKVEVVIDQCDISRMDEAIFRTDSNSSTVTITNTRYRMIGDELFIGVNPSNITQSNNMEY